MTMRLIYMLPVAVLLMGCVPEPLPGGAVPEVGGGLRKVSATELADVAAVRYRHLDAVNALRSSKGLVPVEFDQALNSAALTHARDMALQQRPWSFGSDGSNPVIRAERAGFEGRILGENIAETFEGELDTLQAMLDDGRTSELMLAQSARRIGFAWFREPVGKVWWVQLVGE